MRADQVLGAFATGRLIPPFTDADPAFDEAAGYAVARDVHQQRIAGGLTPIGRKIGFTNRLLWPAFDIWAPIWAHVYGETTVTGDAEVSVDGLPQPLVEPEIQLHFAATPPRTRDEEAILACIDWIALGFEIVQCPYPGWKFRAADSIAAGSLHARLVLGPPCAVSGIEDCAAKLRRFTVTLERNGEAVADGGGANVLDSPLLAFAHLADVLGDDERVQAGEVVTTGTLTNPPPAVAGDVWTIAVDGLDVTPAVLTLR